MRNSAGPVALGQLAASPYLALAATGRMRPLTSRTDAHRATLLSALAAVAAPSHGPAQHPATLANPAQVTNHLGDVNT